MPREEWSAEVRASRILAAGAAIIAADLEHRVAAFDTASGRCAWRYPFSSFAVAAHGRHVLVRASYDEFHLLDLETGRPEGCIPRHAFDSALVAGGIVFMHFRGWGEPDRVSALDLASGRRLWMYLGETDRTRSEEREAFAADTDMVVAGRNGAIVALDAATGAVRWRRAWPQWDEPDGDRKRPSTVGPLLLAGAHVIATVGTHVVGLARDDGRPLWEDEGTADAVRDGMAYAAVRDRYDVRSVATGEVRRLEAAGGGPKSLAPLLAYGSRVELVTETHAYLIAGGAALVAVDRERGKYEWHHHPAGGQRVSGPVSVSGRLYYSNGPRLYCLAPVR